MGRARRNLSVALAAVSLLAAAPQSLAALQTPEQFFGFRIGTDGELARYPKVLEYLQHLAAGSDRVKYRELGRTTLDNAYVLATFSSPQNLARFDELVRINKRLADPRGLSEAEARRLSREGRPFYLLYATIHSTELGNGQAITEIAHRLATEDSPEVKEMLDNAVLLLVPSQNPDGQVLVIDHWYKTKGTGFDRGYPDLYHYYTGHDDNRDWFMFTQKETRLMVEKVQNALKPQITHDMHQQGTMGSRIFVPPFQDPYDVNIHPILQEAQAQVGLAMAGALAAEGKTGVEYNARYDLWTPARQYMLYHGQPRILTEIASVNLADPFVNPAGKDKPLGPQESRWNYVSPYRSGTWTLRQIVDYGKTAVYAGLSHVAKYHDTWLYNYYQVHRDWVARKDAAPFAFVVPAEQRDPYETYEMLEILKTGEVELHRAKAAFSAGGKSYPAGSTVIKLAQPAGAFAKTMLERQEYPDLRLFPGGPPLPPYDVTGHTLWMLMGVEVQAIDAPFEADLEKIEQLAPRATPLPKRPAWAYLIPPESNAGFVALPRLQKAGASVFRAARGFESGGRPIGAGPGGGAPGNGSTPALEALAKETGLPVFGADQAPAVDGWRMSPKTRIGLWRAANNMPGGWLKWLFERYGFDHAVVNSADFQGDPKAKHDVIVLPSGTTRARIVNGLDPKRNGPEWSWAYGVGESGWSKLRDFVRNGGTLVAIGTAVETARELFELPIEKALPEAQRRRGGAAAREASSGSSELRTAFQSPARLMQVLRDQVAEPESLFYCPGTLLANEFDVEHPVAYGMPARWPVFFETNQAYRLAPGFGIRAEAVSRYPKTGKILESGWLLGEEYLRNQANAMSFKVGKGTLVALASEVDYRTQPRATFKLLFNGIFQGTATPVSAAELKRLAAAESARP
jgi:hypothetical protein